MSRIRQATRLLPVGGDVPGVGSGGVFGVMGGDRRREGRVGHGECRATYNTQEASCGPPQGQRRGGSEVGITKKRWQ